MRGKEQHADTEGDTQYMTRKTIYCIQTHMRTDACTQCTCTYKSIQLYCIDITQLKEVAQKYQNNFGDRELAVSTSRALCINQCALYSVILYFGLSLPPCVICVIVLFVLFSGYHRAVWNTHTHTHAHRLAQIFLLGLYIDFHAFTQPNPNPCLTQTLT